MPDRRCLTTFWLVSSLALLATALIAPIRTSGRVSDASRADGLRSHNAPPTTGFAATIDPGAALGVGAVASAMEEQDWADALDESGVSVRVSCAFRKVADRRPPPSRPIHSHYPLRC